MAQLQTKKPRLCSITGGGDYFYTWQNAEIEPYSGEFHSSLILSGSNAVNIGRAKLRVDGQEVGNVHVGSIANFYSPQFTLTGALADWGVTAEQLKSGNVGFKYEMNASDLHQLASAADRPHLSVKGKRYFFRHNIAIQCRQVESVECHFIG